MYTLDARQLVLLQESDFYIVNQLERGFLYTKLSKNVLMSFNDMFLLLEKHEWYKLFMLQMDLYLM